MQSLLDHLKSRSEGYTFEVEELAPSVYLHVQPSDRFKQVNVHLYQLNPLGPEAAERALIPMVLRCGSEAYPTRKAIAERLQELYGSELSVRTSKFGHAHLQSYEVSYIADRFLGEEESAREALDLLQSLYMNPVGPEDENGGASHERDGFRSRYVEQQRKQLTDTIDAMKEQKRSYAIRRCEKLLFMEDPYRFSKYGERSRVAELTADTLYKQYRSDLSQSRLDLVVIGDEGLDPIKNQLLDGLMQSLPEREPVASDPVVSPSDNGDVMDVTEEAEGQQSWLVMGYRTPIVMGHPDMYKLSMTVGLLGGFPHSKLFRRVREEQGLVYSIQASLKRSVGLMLVTAGIDFEKKDETEAAIKRCHQQIIDGSFSEEELQMTRRKLIEQIVRMEDNPPKKAGSYLNRHLIDQVESLSRIAERVMAVDREDIREAAETLTPAITYCRR